MMLDACSNDLDLSTGFYTKMTIIFLLSQRDLLEFFASFILGILHQRNNLNPVYRASVRLACISVQLVISHTDPMQSA
jgi:hypothetical protein